jgi:hypothetical protein
MVAPQSALHLAMGFTRKPTLPQLKRYVGDPTKTIELRTFAMLEVTARSPKRITWLRLVADSKSQSPELRETARQWILMIQSYRGGRAILRRLGVW